MSLISDVGCVLLAEEAPERQALQQLPISHIVNFEPDFWRRADSTCFVSRCATLIFPLYVFCNSVFTLAITVTFFSKMEFGRHFPIHCYGDIFNFGCFTAPAYSMCSQRNCSPFKAFSAILLFSFTAWTCIHYFIPAGASHQIINGTTSSTEGVAWTSPKGSMPQQQHTPTRVEC